jgi:hypothetical protein
LTFLPAGSRCAGARCFFASQLDIPSRAAAATCGSRAGRDQLHMGADWSVWWGSTRAQGREVAGAGLEALIRARGGVRHSFGNSGSPSTLITLIDTAHSVWQSSRVSTTAHVNYRVSRRLPPSASAHRAATTAT